MALGKVCAFASLAGFALLAVAGILAFVGDSNAELRGRVLYAATVPGQTGLSGTPSSESGEGSSSSRWSGSFDNSLFGGNHWATLAPAGAAGLDFVAYIVLGLFCATYAWFYKMHVVDHIQPMPPQEATGEDDFEPGICACIGDICMCTHLLLPCCMYVRQAHTNEVTGICGFWPTFWAYFLTGFCCGVGPCCLTVFFRMRLKEHMGVEDHVLNDLCLAWLCATCAVGQQAMAVDQKLGYEVELCCELKWTEETELVYRDGRTDIDRSSKQYQHRQLQEQIESGENYRYGNNF